MRVNAGAKCRWVVVLLFLHVFCFVLFLTIWKHPTPFLAIGRPQFHVWSPGQPFLAKWKLASDPSAVIAIVIGVIVIIVIVIVIAIVI